MFNAIKSKVSGLLKGFVYLITFKLLFAVLKRIFDIIVWMLTLGYYPLFFYLLGGAYAYLFMELRFDGSVAGIAYIWGIVFWSVAGTLTAWKNLERKRMDRLTKREFDKEYSMKRGEFEARIINRRKENRLQKKLRRRQAMAEYIAPEVLDSYIR